MLSVSISDLVNLLDQIPIWKTIKDLPKRVESLEAENGAFKARLDAIEATPKKTPGQPCPTCGAHGLRRTATKPSGGHFANMGLRDETWTCGECGATDEREMIPSSG